MDHLEIIQNLKKLQASLPADRKARAAILAQPTPDHVALRAEIPAVVLSHFDRLVRQGRPGIAPLRNGVCGGCHIRAPRAQVAGMRGSHGLDVCDQCGAFVFSEEMLSELSQPVAVVAN